MPLRARLIALIGVVLLISLMGGGALVGWHAAGSVRTELRAALDVGANTVRNGLDAAGRADAARLLIATFDGNRHIRATLLDGGEQPLATSTLFVPARPAPGWFRDLIAGPQVAARIPVARFGDGAVILLRTDPANETSEVWAESRDAMSVLAGFALLSALLTGAVVGRALRPLEDLSNAFDRIGKGDYHGAVIARGPPELVRLARGVNVMTGRLATIAAQNRRLNERLLTLQAEERADLARDLHDEVGPLLFAVDMTAATIDRLAAAGRVDEIPGQARSVQDAVGRMQRHVRLLLGRLRPMHAFGLPAAIERLAVFWRARAPDVAIVVAVTVDEDDMDDDLRETIYRIAQEGMSNAIRHGKPARIDIAVAPDEHDAIRVEVTDDGIGMAMQGASRRDPNHLGLIGMRERVMTVAGSLSVLPGRDGRGLTLIARLPRASSPRFQNESDAA